MKINLRFFCYSKGILVVKIKINLKTINCCDDKLQLFYSYLCDKQTKKNHILFYDRITNYNVCVTPNTDLYQKNVTYVHTNFQILDKHEIWYSLQKSTRSIASIFFG